MPLASSRSSSIARPTSVRAAASLARHSNPGRVTRPVGGEPQPHGQRGEALLGAVVEVSVLEASSFGVGCVD